MDKKYLDYTGTNILVTHIKNYTATAVSDADIENATAIKDEKIRAESAETGLSKEIEQFKEETNKEFAYRKVKSKLVTLESDLWDESMTQTVTVEGILADESLQLIQAMPSVSCKEEYDDVEIQMVNQNENSITFKAREVPLNNVSVYITFQPVEVI